ncbi:DUF2945 domain-containing protein [Rhodococcus kroppenstedtii]|uniref:Hypervirulence associated protein TUDOR domain-containing protein n=1 Tax=Rhodococcoides kroppenstedtii TaxID=293050 RepID=A0A1I0U2E1_9NOCA|nr:DUF2945 domain-containing protein [Rhodococcus kroppenstedtii]MBT1193119.1 DUF2945 domain-containing protein [Rhodococcus kroppenstedtii]MDV7198841.1 DUF2945 domain-containing protein [Rhodococcus kroppenstedtii]NIL79559.1 hypothetical protein [Rhodococcus kroppenstedtii]SFA58205.1 Protein of unknown function [Rhodococcus kroppenstedtii]
MTYKKGTKVQWKWGDNTAEGKVVEVHKEKVSKKIKGSEITRNGTDDNPAYLLEQEDGTQLLKLDSELEKD